MENLIDELHKDHIKFSKVLDLLAEQLDIIQKGKPADFYLLLDAVSYIENYPEYALVPKEDAIFKNSTENHNFVALNNTIKRLRSENHELRALAHKLHDYIDAALEGSIFEKELFERQLETCIQRQRDHMNKEEGIVFPLLKRKLSAKQLRQINKDFQTQTKTLTCQDLSCKYSELYHRITDMYDSNYRQTH